MGARLHYAKVLDQYLFLAQGGRVHPGLPNKVVARTEGGRTAAFLVLRAWGDDHGTFTEQWRIESPQGSVLYESVPREIHLASKGHLERLEDEVADLEVDGAGDDYLAVFSLDEHEVARVTFAVEPETG
jgi:hypothetical protein